MGMCPLRAMHLPSTLNTCRYAPVADKKCNTCWIDKHSVEPGHVLGASCNGSHINI